LLFSKSAFHARAMEGIHRGQLRTKRRENQMTKQEWKDRCEVNDRSNLRKYYEILSNANFALANSKIPELRAFAQIIINISERKVK